MLQRKSPKGSTPRGGTGKSTSEANTRMSNSMLVGVIFKLSTLKSPVKAKANKTLNIIHTGTKFVAAHIHSTLFSRKQKWQIFRANLAIRQLQSGHCTLQGKPTFHVTS